MEIIKISKTEPFFSKPGIIGKSFFNSPGLDIVHLELEPNAKLQPHPMPMTVLFYVLEGSGILSINGKNYELHKDDGIECPKDLLRFWRNESSEKLKVLVLKMKEQE